MTIASQTVKDPSGLPARRTVVRFDRTQALDPDGAIVGNVTAYVVVQAPLGLGVAASDVEDTLKLIAGTLDPAAASLSLSTEIFTNQEQ
jgi:hypothetical protein